MDITKTELARQLEVTPSRIGQLVKRGMPTLESGKLNFQDALTWIAKYQCSSRGGWNNRRGKRTSIAERASELLGCKHVTPSGIVTIDGAPGSQQTADDLILALRFQALPEFARLCIGCGFSPRDTFFATNLHLFAVLMAFDGADFFEADPTDDEWRAVLGNVDVDALYAEYETVMMPFLKRQASTPSAEADKAK